MPYWDIQKQKKAFGFGGGARPPITDSALDPAGGSAPDLRAYPQLQSCHYTTGLHLFLIHIHIA